MNENIEENIIRNQFGGMGGASTTDALVEMIHRWSEATGKLDHYVRVALLDFSKASDLINHNILLGFTIASLLDFSFLIRSFLVLPSISTCSSRLCASFAALLCVAPNTHRHIISKSV